MHASTLLRSSARAAAALHRHTSTHLLDSALPKRSAAQQCGAAHVDTLSGRVKDVDTPSLARWSDGRMHRHSAAAAAAQRHATTVLCVRKGDKVVIMADGQVTQGTEIVKPNVRKVRRIAENVISGFAGSTADAFTLFERLEAKLEEHPGQLMRAAVDLAKSWRTDKFLRRLEAVIIVADPEQSLTITGNGDVLEPHDGVIGIGSGGSYALAAARALMDLPDMDAEAIAKKAMTIAADICIYTNHNFVTQTLSTNTSADSPKSAEPEAVASSSKDITSEDLSTSINSDAKST